jgi:hypothetical protein
MAEIFAKITTEFGNIGRQKGTLEGYRANTNVPVGLYICARGGLFSADHEREKKKSPPPDIGVKKGKQRSIPSITSGTYTPIDSRKQVYSKPTPTK